MNEGGDMLRIATTVKGKDGDRAIGTYIPAVNQDGQANPVVSSVLKGQEYSGRAFVVNGWYITGYSPIMNGERQVIGMLYVGIPQESLQDLTKSIMSIGVGRTGYVYVLDSKGRYIISKDGKRDGEDISDSRDATGNLFIQEICKKAVALKPGELAEHRYPFQNEGEAKPRMKLAKIMYFKDWDWVIGAGSYEDEFLESAREMEKTGSRSGMAILAVVCVSLLGAAGVWILMARGIARPIQRSIEAINEGADQVSSGATQVAASSQTLAEGASEQAASLEETSSSLEEMASMTRLNAEHADQADALMKEAGEVVDHANGSMRELTKSMEEITRASEETSKIVKTIDEIAFQTNLLALNAAVEAARAGEAGAGFAVVADEVRNLAMRAADAAKNTAGMIEGTVKKVKDGSALVTRTNEAFVKVADTASKVAGLVAEIATASKEQSQGIEQVNKAVAEMDKVVQQNAANAEENASASEEMNSQAVQMKDYVNELATIVEGGGGKAARSKQYAVGSERSRRSRKETVVAPAEAAVEKAVVPAKPREMSPEQVIPLNGADFRDF
jgi:X-X-X-Leu-X-X-Gly heptad repeat protein